MINKVLVRQKIWMRRLWYHFQR